MPTRASIVQKWFLGMVGYDYTLGEESYGLVTGTQQTADPNDVDCSGVGYSGITMANRELKTLGLKQILWKDGSLWPRLTADRYRRSATKITDKSLRILDIFCFTNSDGRTYHIAWYVGNDRFLDADDDNEQIVESRGRAYGVKKYTVDYLQSRGAVHYRFSWIGDLGESVPQPARPLLAQGSSGSAVKKAQLRLNAHMGPMLRGTGSFGPVTHTVVRWFQGLKDLEIDGIIGEQTWGALLKDPVFPELRRGAIDSYCGLMKHWLNRNGATLTETNWIFGPATEAAVRRYQTAKGLKVDGVVGKITWGSLLAQ